MQLSRRRLVSGLAVTAAAAGTAVFVGQGAFQPAPSAPAGLPAAGPSPISAPAVIRSQPGSEDVRRVLVHNLHTGDSLDAVYFENDRYVPQALAEAMRVMRDWRNGEEHVMDPRLFDAHHQIRRTLETEQPFQIISGYRSPATNAMMHERSSGVASHSQHILGKATDIRVQGVELRHLHAAAVAVGAGGVGFYPVSDFVHVDVGPVRQWTGV